MTPLHRVRWSYVVGAVIVLFAAVQAVPYGRAHVNPPVVQEPAWDSPATRELARRACFDCHSNETRWPIYSLVAPISWLVQRDVDEGRAAVNFSEWNRPQAEASDAAETLQEGEMPPLPYRMMHADARLSAPERERLTRGLMLTLGAGEHAVQAEER
jgi:hypothetical protein